MILRTCASGLLLALVQGSVYGQGTPTLLILSQPAAGVPKERFVDLGPHLQPELSGRFKVLIYQPTLPSIQDAIKGGSLSVDDVQSPVSRAAAHRIAKAVGASLLLHVSADASKQGISLADELETLSGQNAWSQTFVDNVSAAAIGKRKLSLLEHIHLHVDSIVKKLTGTGIGVLPAGKGIRFGPDGKLPDEPSAAGSPATPSNPSNVLTPNRAVPGPVTQSPALAPAPRPDNLSTYQLLIDRARRNNDVASLIVALRRAINERPRDARLRRELAEAYRQGGWQDLAKDEIIRAIAMGPPDGAGSRLMGDLLRDAGDIPGALKEYREASRLSPQDPLCRMAYGDALVADGKPDDAVKEYAAAAVSDPKSPAPFLRIARVGVGRGMYASATTSLTAAKALVSGSADPAVLADCGAILTVAETTLVDTLSRLQMAGFAFAKGTKSREDAFKEVTALRKKADEMATFLDGMPDLGLTQPQALLSQASALAVQAADKLLEHLESQGSGALDESNLLRIEANKQIGEGSKRLIAMLSNKP